MESNINLYSIGLTEEEAISAWRDDPYFVARMAEANQIELEKKLGTRNARGEKISDKDQMRQFSVIMGCGYFPIVGDLIIPPGSGLFVGQGSFVRRKSVARNLKGITQHTTALCPIGGIEGAISNTNGVLTQCGSSKIQDFSISGCLKNIGDGGNGLIFGHTPPLEGGTTAPPTSQEYWAHKKNTVITQQRFVEPKVWTTNPALGNETGLAETRNDLVFGDFDNESSFLKVPGGGSFCCPQDVFLDETVDIPLLRWVRAFDEYGKEIIRYCNAGESIVKGKRSQVGLNSEDRMTTGRPADEGEHRAYHLISDNDAMIIIPEPLPENTASVEVSFYNLQEFNTLQTEMTPYLSGSYYAMARASLNDYSGIVVDEMPWNGFVAVDGAYNTHRDLIARNCGLDGWYFPGGYEDYMHNQYLSCAAVNNEGWGCFINEPIKCSRSALDKGKWPNELGELETHVKYTYTAATNDYGNFDCYGNRGGAYYFGAFANTMTTGSTEAHFDCHNFDPFLSSKKERADWNPARWVACVVFAAVATANQIRMVSTPTDSRRVLFCRSRIKEETPAPTNPNSNHYGALSANHYRHPRPDSYGSLIDVRSPSAAHWHLSPYEEHERDGGEMHGKGSGVGELQAAFSGFNEVTFRPWTYDRTPKEAHEDSTWNVKFSARNDKLPGTAKEVVLAADAIGVEGEGAINHLHHLSFKKTFTGSEKATIIHPGQTLNVKKIISFIDGISSLPLYEDDSRFESFDFKHLTVTSTYIHDEISDPDAPPLPDSAVLMPARAKLYQHNTSAIEGNPKRMQVILPLFNGGSEPILLDGQTHTFSLKIEIGRED